MMMYYQMLSSGGQSGDSMLPLILMQLEGKKNSNGEGDSNGNGMNSEVLDVMLYRPMGERILANFTAKIAKMNATQRNKLLASLSLDLMSTQQKGKFGETLLLASRSGMMELLGEPLAVAGIEDKKGNGNVGGMSLGSARKTVIEQAKELEVEEGEGKEKKDEKASNANTLHREVIVT